LEMYFSFFYNNKVLANRKFPSEVFIDTLSLLFVHLKLQPELKLSQSILKKKFFMNLFGALDHFNSNFKQGLLKSLVVLLMSSQISKGSAFPRAEFFSLLTHFLKKCRPDNSLCEALLTLSYLDMG